MKKILTSLLVVASIVFSIVAMTACNQLTPEQVINGAIEKTENLDNYHAVVNMSISMEAGSETMTIPMQSEIKIKNAKSENPTVYNKTSISMFGTSQTSETYYDDEWIYVAAGGTGFKASIEDAEDILGDTEMSAGVEEILKDLPKDLFEDVKLVLNEDGTQTVVLNIPEEVFAEIYDDMIDSVTGTLGTSDLTSLEVSDTIVSVTVNKGYISCYDMSFNMSMTLFGQSIDIKVEADIEYKDIDGNIEITPPEGYENFKILDQD